MAKLLKLRRGTTSQHSSFTGAEGEVTVDTDKETLVVHNGSTAGGFPVMSASGGTFTGAVTFNSDLDLQDSDKLLIGTGDDLQIFHDGSDSYIKDTGTGQLILQSDEFRVRNAAGDELIILADEDGAVKLYYDGVQKFETLSTGWGVANNIEWHATQNSLDFYDSKKASFGSSRDLQIYHDGSHSWIENINASQNLIIESQATTGIRGSTVHLTNVDGSHNLLVATAGGSTDLYYNNSKKFETTNTGISVTGKIEISDDLNLTGASYNALWDKSANTLKFNDSAKVTLGTGDDVTFYHNGSNTFLNSGTGYLLIHNTGADSTILRGAQDVFLQPAGGEQGVIARANGNTELYHDNAKKFETNSQGTRFYGRAYFDDNNKIEMGAAADLKICHDGTNTTYISTTGDNYFKSAGNTYIRCAGDENAVVAVANGEVKLYHNNSQKLHTTASGIEITGGIEMDDGQQIKLGDGQELKIWHDSNSHSYITESGSGGVVLGGSQVTLMNLATTEAYVRCYDNNTTELFYDNSKKLHTTSSGVYITGHCDFADVDKLRLGASQDLDLYHDGTNSFIRSSTGQLIIRNNNLRLQAYNGENYLTGTENGAVELMHNNSKKLETTSSGITVTGTITATGGGLGGLYDAHAFIEDRKGAGVNGGTFSSGAWRHRDLNTEVYDPDGIVSISSNNFALAGSSSDKYRVYFIAPAYKVDVHQARLYCTTNSSVITYGMATVSKGNAPVTSESMGEARCDGGKTYRIEHYSWQTIGGDGFGSTWEANWCQGRFTQIQIQREAS